MLGKFYGIGVGPGDKELLTLKAQRVLSDVPVVAVPYSKAEKDSVALQIAEDFLIPEHQVVKLLMPMTHDVEKLKEAWQQAALNIKPFLLEGKDVAFLTLGDASLYSTYTYLLDSLKEELPEVEVETIPGITSFSASAALVNTPLAEGKEPLAVIPALENPENLREILKIYPNVALMKVAPQIDGIVDILEEHGLADQATFLSKVGHEDQQIIKGVSSLKGTKPGYLSLMLIKQGGK